MIGTGSRSVDGEALQYRLTCPGAHLGSPSLCSGRSRCGRSRSFLCPEAAGTSLPIRRLSDMLAIYRKSNKSTVPRVPSWVAQANAVAAAVTVSNAASAAAEAGVASARRTPPRPPSRASSSVGKELDFLQVCNMQTQSAQTKIALREQGDLSCADLCLRSAKLA